MTLSSPNTELKCPSKILFCLSMTHIIKPWVKEIGGKKSTHKDLKVKQVFHLLIEGGIGVY